MNKNALTLAFKLIGFCYSYMDKINYVVVNV